MSETRLAHLYASLGDDPAEISIYRWEAEGEENAVLKIGARLSLQLWQASPEVLDRLAECAAELAAWKRQQQAEGEVAA